MRRIDGIAGGLQHRGQLAGERRFVLGNQDAHDQRIPASN
jgi:hypothetical protein